MLKFWENRLTPLQLLFLVPSGFILFYILAAGFMTTHDQEFVQLAVAFYHGHFNFLSYPAGVSSDLVIWKDHYYWALGPFPGIFLIPFVWIFTLFHLAFYQSYLQWLLTLGVFLMVIKFAKKIKFSNFDSYILGFGFVLGTAFIGISMSSGSWLFAQVLTTFLLFASILEFYGKKRWWLIGILCGFIALTRISAAPIIIFYLLELIVSRPRNSNRKILYKQIIYLCLPLFIAVLALAYYNYARFGNLFEEGYSYQHITNANIYDRVYGLFSIRYLPGNLYYFLFSFPTAVFRNNLTHILKYPFIKASPWGLSIFFTSPFFIYLFFVKKSYFDGRTKRMLIAILVSAAMVLTYYGIGYTQYGYRYALDFLPLLYVLFMIKYRQNNKTLSLPMRLLLIVPGVVNFYLIYNGLLHG